MAYLLALVCGVWLWVCHFPIGILSQVWYLVVSIADLCTLAYFDFLAYLVHKRYECPNYFRRSVMFNRQVMSESVEFSAKNFTF